MALIKLVDRYGIPTGETADRTAAYRPSFQGIKPHGHVLLFDPHGQLYTEIRSKHKAAWPGRELPIIGGNANPNREGDFYQNGDGEKINYKAVTANELREEVGITIPRDELKRIQGIQTVVNFQELGTAYLAVHWAVYDPSDHGTFRLNPRETEGLVLRHRESFPDIHAELPLSQYGTDLIVKAEEISRQIESLRRA